MANINVAVQKTIADGYKVKFRTPCDSTTIEGLEVKYPAKNGVGTLIKSFVFKDAHGTELSGVGNLFVSGVMIEVLLDVTHGVAYIQNADTNSYIESVKREISTIEKNTKEMLKLAEKAVVDCEDATSNANQAADTAKEAAGGIVTIEQNNQTPLKFWVGSKEEYDAIEAKDNGVFYIISDDADYQEIVNAIEILAGVVEKNTEDIQENEAAIEALDKAVKDNAVAIQGKAPGDYGLGGCARWVANDAHLEDCQASGWYAWGNDNTDPNKPFSAGGMIVIARNNGHLLQFAYDASYGNMAVRYQAVTWHEWSYLNPKMIEYKEYLTNEWYLGHPVYTKVVSVNANKEVFNDGSETYSLAFGHGITGICFIKSVSAIHKYDNTSFKDMSSFGGYGLCVTDTQVQLTYDTPLVGGIVYVELKYTKG